MYAKMLSEPTLLSADARAAVPWVQRRCNLDVREFAAGYLRPRRPVVLTDALREWQALRVFTPNFFRQRFANVPVQSGNGDVMLGEAIDLLASAREKPGADPCVLADCTELLPYLTPRFAYSLPSRHAHRLLPRGVFAMMNHLRIVFGGPGASFTGPRRDMLCAHTWIAQIHGEKEIVLYEPEQEHLLYVDPAMPWLSTVNDAADFAAYPRLREARRQRILLRPGDALFVPRGTWYATRCLNMNISVTFDQLERGNWNDFVDAVFAAQLRCGRDLRGLAYGVWLRLLGPVLHAAEWLGADRAADWGCDASTGWKAARRCPARRI
jgi:hypothetical protein